HQGKIFGGVNADGLVRADDGVHLVPVLNKAHHVVFLGTLQKGFGGVVVESQGLTAVQLDAGDFLILKVQGSLGVGNGAAGDHQDLPGRVGHDFLVGKVDDIGRVLHDI